MMHFIKGFIKEAAVRQDQVEVENPQQPQKPDWKRKYLAPAVAGLAAGGGLYAALRNPVRAGKASQQVVKSLPYKEPKTRIGKWLDKALYSADDIVYTAGKKPGKLTKTKGIAVHYNPEDYRYVKGKTEYGSMRDPGVKRFGIGGDKRYESQLMNKHKVSPHNYLTGKVKGEEAITDLHGHFKDKAGYYLKPSTGFASGIGGGGFINHADVENYLAGKKLSKNKMAVLEHFKKNPHHYVAQEHIDILPGKEFRIHAVGGKVIPEGTMSRTAYPHTQKELQQAERFAQKFFAKLPKKLQRTMYAADIAKTKNGYKFIELNAGSAASGLADVKEISKENLSYGLPAYRTQKAITKHITGGREAPATTQLENAVKGVGSAAAGAGVAYGTHEILNHPGAQETIQTQKVK